MFSLLSSLSGDDAGTGLFLRFARERARRLLSFGILESLLSRWKNGMFNEVVEVAKRVGGESVAGVYVEATVREADRDGLYLWAIGSGNGSGACLDWR